MVGLLKKDFALLKSQLHFYLFPLIIMVGIFCVFTDGSAMAAIPAFFGLMLSVNCFAYDEQSHFDKLAATMPVSHSGAVYARYLYGLLISVAAAVFATAATAVTMLVKKLPLDMASLLVQMAAGIGVPLLIIAVFYPLVYKFGTQKSRLLVVVVILVPSFALPFLMKKLEEGGVHLSFDFGGNPALLPILLVLLIAAGKKEAFSATEQNENTKLFLLFCLSSSTPLRFLLYPWPRRAVSGHLLRFLLW